MKTILLCAKKYFDMFSYNSQAKIYASFSCQIDFHCRWKCEKFKKPQLRTPNASILNSFRKLNRSRMSLTVEKENTFLIDDKIVF